MYKDITVASGSALTTEQLEETLSEAQAVKLTGQNAETFALETDVTLLALVGIEDPLRETVPPAIETCNQAGVDVRMVREQNFPKGRFTGKHSHSES